MKGAVISTCFSLSPLYVYIYFFLYKTSLSVLKKEGLEYHLSHISTVDRQIQSLIHHIFYLITSILLLKSLLCYSCLALFPTERVTGPEYTKAMSTDARNKPVAITC